MTLLITLIVCCTVLIGLYLVTKVGITINMTYTNKDKAHDIIGDINKDGVQNNAIDDAIAEIYDAFDINIDSGEENK